MRIKQKFSSVVKHVKSNPALYSYIAGVAIATTATYIVLSKHFDKQLKEFITGDHMVNLEIALEAIKKGELSGLYFPVDNDTLLLLVAPDDFKP